MNRVISGDYKGKGVMRTLSGVCITLPMLKTLPISKDTVDSYEIINKDTQVSSFDAVRRSNNWSFFFGASGYAAALGAKQKGIYWIAVQFKDGKRSLLEVNDALFKAITVALF